MDTLNYEQKLAKIMLQLRVLRPFFSALYESIEKVETEDVPTMGVSTNKLYYNKDFIDKMTLEELVFINLHELSHIALMHVARQENRDPNLWNIACDLYVNQCLLEEYGIYKSNGNMVYSNGIGIKMPEDGCFCTSIDIDNDYTEIIYESLDKQAKENGYYSDLPGEYSFKYKGHKEQSVLSRDFYNQHKTFEITLNNGAYLVDLINEGIDQNQKDQQSRKIITDAKVRADMLGGNSAGSMSGNIERFVDDLLKSRLDWKKLFKKYLIQMTNCDSSFLMPDKRMYYQKAIYPGQISEESNHINGVKICIDTSGSISNDDMKAFYYQVYTILSKFKVDAELIYWDAEIQSVGQVKDYGEFRRIYCAGGGGTNPAVVFERFVSKKEKPNIILIFTDGYFYGNWCDKSYHKKFKNTIWVMTRNYNSGFEPPFGKLAIAKFD